MRDQSTLSDAFEKNVIFLIPVLVFTVKIAYRLTMHMFLSANVACQQLAPGQLKSKVDEIAQAYTEGYKAALSAMRARSIIERNMVMKKHATANAGVRSMIPKPVAASQPQRNPVTGFTNAAAYNFPARQITVNGVEKSGIPRPAFQAPFRGSPVPGNSAHTVVERSASPLLGQFMHQQAPQVSSQQQQQQFQQRSSIPAAFAAQPAVARQPSASNAASKSQMSEIAKLNAAARNRNVYLDSVSGNPYGGSSGVLSRQYFQLHRHRRSLDYQPQYAFPGVRKSRMPYFGQDLDKLGIVRAVPAGSPDAAKHTPVPNKVKHIEVARLNPGGPQYPMEAERRSDIVPPPMQQMQEPQPMNSFASQYMQQRSYVPAAVQQPVKQENDKRDMIAKLNRAAYHRNVYLDSMSGDPYNGGGGVLSRQRFWLKKHKRSAEDY
eukprot:gene18013-19814_t